VEDYRLDRGIMKEELVEIIENFKEKLGMPNIDDKYYEGYFAALDDVLLVIKNKF
jgi:hypothetical protein